MKGNVYVNVKKLMEGEKPVHCAECRHFKRNTSGRSFSIETGEYFIGVCEVGVLTVGSSVKFADKPRHCKRWEGIA